MMIKLAVLALIEFVAISWLVLYTGRHFSIWKFESDQIEFGTKTLKEVLGGRIKRSLAVVGCWLLFTLCLVSSLYLL